MQMMELQLEETKNELNTSKRTVDEMFGDDLFQEEELTASSTPNGKHPLKIKMKAAVKKSTEKELTKEGENRAAAEPVPKKVKIAVPKKAKIVDTTTASDPSDVDDNEEDDTNK
ncbi:hypothetical protein DPMN_012835 [Dreissena polymorpha]|uniref:Uncharacterized protein n=1 Tax=Dreissena polymorpha TaxID=45954 RepID=A0A9D4S341_DREPO|nr:hypothetical protein DPMN_012835 [Dreissena polymorpha]